MHTLIQSDSVTFAEDSLIAGRYVLDDAFKPYLHPLKTPAGHLVSGCITSDHRHHKGLMYALRSADLNFWEENPGTDQCGVQRSLSVEPLAPGDAAGGAGIRQRLRWQHESGERATYDETREIFCRHDPAARAFVWTWRSHRTALRAHRLVKSFWSYPVEDGRKINYHGLGVRFPWSWAFEPGNMNGVECDGVAKPWKEACGSTGRSVGYWGRIDGFWTPPIAAVTITQEQNFAFYVMRAGFAYLSVGPSNVEELEVQAGQTFAETYHIRVEDR